MDPIRRSVTALSALKVREDKAIPVDDFAWLNLQWSGEHGAGVDAGMKLAALAAGVDRGGEVGEEFGGEFAAGEAAVEMPGIDAGEVRSEAAGDHLAGELIGGDLPAGEDGFEAGGGKFGDAVGADVFEEEVAKRYAM